LPDTRVPLPKITNDSENGFNLFTSLHEDKIQEYEKGFMNCLLDYIKCDDDLSHFYIRLICECENVMKVIDFVNQIDLLELEEIVDNITNAKNLEAVSQYDAEFHKRLFAITGEVGFFKWWLMQSDNLHRFLVNLWKSIGYQTVQYHELIILHNQIFQSIKNKNQEEAIIAMQKHFALVFFQLLGTMYHEPQDLDNRV
jgi:DNA-binding GntR family transcriptional regulator